MDSDRTAIIVGASHAGCQLAFSLRQEGWEGRILLLGEEPAAAYNRPPLSKGYLLGDQQRSELPIRTDDAYAKSRIEWQPTTRVVCIDAQAKQVVTDAGSVLAYDELALCTGARARTVQLPGIALGGVHTLRTLADVDAIRSGLPEVRQAVILGGGYIGLETAAALRKLGVEVTVLEMAPRVLARVTAPVVSAFYERVFHEEGVRIVTGASVERIEGTDRVEAVLCTDGSRIPAQLVVVGVGVVPNVELAAEAGVRVDDGIVVDAFGRTSAPHVVAAGDCTRHPSLLYGMVRLESVPNAMEQARAAAATLCGKLKPHEALPWFWSDQFDVKLQIAGLNCGHDQVVLRGDAESGRRFSAFYLRVGRLIAADCVNRPADFIGSKKLIAAGVAVDARLLADEDIKLSTLLNPA
ncbi:MAG TPA: FAD-dependent oxidoreductase [Ramlibacter sp.]|nr:FAD-dependent oxidoreductase [Ramlibacter sp.]